MYRTLLPILVASVGLTACESPEDDLFTTGSSSSTTSSTSTATVGSTSGSTTVASSTSSSSSAGSSGSGGSGGAPPTFEASCSGTLDCPTIASCATWSYAVTDDGTQTVADVTVTPTGSEPCTQSTTFDDASAPNQGPRDEVTVQCGPQTWSVALDRSTMVLYIEAGQFSWTPQCIVR